MGLRPLPLSKCMQKRGKEEKEGLMRCLRPKRGAAQEEAHMEGIFILLGRLCVCRPGMPVHRLCWGFCTQG